MSLLQRFMSLCPTPSVKADDDLINCLIAHEGNEKFAYKDSLGYLTIGIGRCIDSKKGKGLTDDERIYLLSNDIKECKDDLCKLDWFQALDVTRQGVIVEMRFNLGMAGLLAFKSMIEAIKAKDYAMAMAEMKNSKWATQIGSNRLDNMCHRMLVGKYK